MAMSFQRVLQSASGPQGRYSSLTFYWSPQPGTLPASWKGFVLRTQPHLSSQLLAGPGSQSSQASKFSVLLFSNTELHGALVNFPLCRMGHGQPSLLHRPGGGPSKVYELCMWNTQLASPSRLLHACSHSQVRKLSHRKDRYRVQDLQIIGLAGTWEITNIPLYTHGQEI